MGHYVIIGGGGFLGAHIISKLQFNGSQRRIIVVDPHPQTFSTIPIDKELVTYIRESFLDAGVLDRVLPGASAVFHLAAIGHTGLRCWDKELIFDFNVNGTKQLVEKCREYEVSRFLYASSVAVAFVGDPLYGASEDDPLPHPKRYLDHYSASKAEAEKYVLEQSNTLFKTTSLRFRAIYGPEDPNVTGKVANLIGNGMFFGIVSMHNRESISASSSGVNCAKAFYLADQALQKKDAPHGRSYFILDEDNVGQYEFWNPLIRALGQQPPTRFIPYSLVKMFLPLYEFGCYRIFGVSPILKKFELAILAMDNTYSIARARRELGYEPEPSLMPAVAEYYEQLQQVRQAKDQCNWRISIMFVAGFLALLLSLVLYRLELL